MQTYSFGDVRLDRRADIITEQIVATGSLVPRRFGGGRKGELAAGRFLDSPKVTPEAILETHINRTAAAAQGRRRIVAIQDTTEVNFSGRDRSRKGLGPGADGKAKGFFIHATVAVDPEEEVSVIARFDGYRGRYLLHCHNLEHEDHSMMARFDVA